MADRFPGEIHIGGTLRLADHDREDVDAFLAECSEQPIEWGGSAQRDPLTLETIHQVIDPETGWIIFRDHQACYGMFEELEEICRKLGLSYDRTSEAKYEYDGELARWRPGMESGFTSGLVQKADQSGNALIDRARVEECLATLQDGRIEEGIKALQDLLPEVAPLPPFEVDAAE